MNNPSAEFMAQGPNAIRDYVRKQLTGEASVDPKMNWHGLAFSAAHNAHQGSDAEIWSSIAVQIYDWLASKDAEPDHSSFMDSGMMPRVNWLRHAPGTDAEAGQRRQEILGWFRRSCELSISDATDRAGRWTELPVIPDVRTLRLIKNKLRVVELMFRFSAEKPCSEVAQWLELRDWLP